MGIPVANSIIKNGHGPLTFPVANSIIKNVCETQPFAFLNKNGIRRLIFFLRPPCTPQHLILTHDL